MKGVNIPNFLFVGETDLKFTSKKGSFVIPYSQVTSVEYRQKAGRRVAVAVLVSPVALFSKKRKHYLTLGWNDDTGKKQGAVVELGKELVRTTLVMFEARTGKKVEYESEEARKNAGN